jgi:hypothetical protein
MCDKCDFFFFVQCKNASCNPVTFDFGSCRNSLLGRKKGEGKSVEKSTKFVDRGKGEREGKVVEKLSKFVDGGEGEGKT